MIADNAITDLRCILVAAAAEAALMSTIAERKCMVMVCLDEKSEVHRRVKGTCLRNERK